MRLFTLTMLAILFSVVTSFAITPISPSTGSLCVGGYLNLADSLAPGGTWSCSPTSVATISGTTTGYLYGVSAGVVNVTYTTGSGTVYGTYTVSPTPGPITGGPTQFCVGSGGTMMDATSGGVWSSSSPGTASVGAASGIVTGVSGGYAYIYYTVAGCSVMVMDTVNETFTDPIAGPTTVCLGSTINLTDTVGAGSTWSSSDPAIASVNTSGVVTGLSLGTTTISLAFTGICGTAYSTKVVTVTGGTIGSISGPSSVAVGASGSFYCSPSGGTWSISPTTVATIDASGVVSGVSTGTAIITYTAMSCGTMLTTTASVTVTAFDGISGHVLFSTPYYGGVKVWLINYNTSTFDLEASDSITVYCSGTSVYYQFTGSPSDSFRVKAAIPDSFSTGTTGYIPTYHSSFFYWHDATAFYHTSGTSSINEDITMLTGTTVSGPGFISGSVLTGANRGTSGSVPVIGLHIVAKSNTSGNVVQMAYTDASGNYSLNNLPYDTYTVFPDSLNYATLPYTAVTLNSSNPTYNSAGFMQHTITKSITPYVTGTKNISSQVSSVSVYPNPTSGKLNIFWNENATEKATIIISDITGREIFNTTVTMTEGSGVTPIDLSTFNSGLYMISVKSTSLNYNNKIEIQH